MYDKDINSIDNYNQESNFLFFFLTFVASFEQDGFPFP